jgi:transcriptional regulator with XRE-family HTH domain
MGLRLRQIRKAKKYSQAHCAGILGVTTATYCKYERHTIPITAEHLAILAHAVEVPIEEFFEREPMTPHANGREPDHG